MTMNKASLVLFVFSLATSLLATHVSPAPSSVPIFEYKFCNFKFGNYTTNSKYQRNLVTALSTLQEHASLESFYNTSAGIGANKVHAQYYCRGDVSTSLCNDCVTEAAIRALNCSNAKAGIIWYDQCTLRYKNKSMYRVIDKKPILYSRLSSNVTNPGEFSVLLNDTVSKLIQEVAYGRNGSIKYFATRERVVSSFTTAYFLVQCSPDLRRKQCESCLLAAFNTTHTCCGKWPIYLYTFPPSCQVMYNTESIFYFAPNTSSSSPPPLSSSALPPLMAGSEPPSPPPVTSTQTSTTPSTGGSPVIRSGDSMKFGIITIALVFFMLVFHG